MLTSVADRDSNFLAYLVINSTVNRHAYGSVSTSHEFSFEILMMAPANLERRFSGN